MATSEFAYPTKIGGAWITTDGDEPTEHDGHLVTALLVDMERTYGDDWESWPEDDRVWFFCERHGEIWASRL